MIFFETKFWKRNCNQNWSCDSVKAVAIRTDFLYLWLIFNTFDSIILNYRLYIDIAQYLRLIESLFIAKWARDETPFRDIFQRWIKKRRNFFSIHLYLRTDLRT